VDVQPADHSGEPLTGLVRAQQLGHGVVQRPGGVVAAPERVLRQGKTSNPPLDAEAEMAAVLDAVAGIAPEGRVRVLEMASISAIRQALAQDAYHVLHLSAHGSPQAIELEDEDGNPVTVSLKALMQALRHSGQPVPLIVLSSCSGGAAGSHAIAAELVALGADRVIAMLAPVTDNYTTVLARTLYRELAARPELTAGQAMARARYLAEESRATADICRMPMPEYGVASLLAAVGDGPLVDVAAAPVPLAVATTPPAGN
jgi:CHAT domain-containing protein